MFKIAVCDDDAVEQTHTAALLRGYFKRRPALRAVISLFDSGQALLDAAKEGQGFDLYVLDIIMPGKNGIETGKALRKLGRDGAILYLTASPDYAVESYLTQAFFYLVKPVGQKQLFDVLDRAIADLRERKNEATIVNTPSGLRSIPLDNILYVERVDRFARYYLENGETVDSRTIRGPFREEMAPLLADERFVLCGVSFVLNLYHLKAVEKTEVLLDSGGRLPLSRTAFGEVKKAWMDYWLEGD